MPLLAFPEQDFNQKSKLQTIITRDKGVNPLLAVTMGIYAEEAL